MAVVRGGDGWHAAWEGAQCGGQETAASGGWWFAGRLALGDADDVYVGIYCSRLRCHCTVRRRHRPFCPAMPRAGPRGAGPSDLQLEQLRVPGIGSGWRQKKQGCALPAAVGDCSRRPRRCIWCGVLARFRSAQAAHQCPFGAREQRRCSASGGRIGRGARVAFCAHPGVDSASSWRIAVLIHIDGSAPEAARRRYMISWRISLLAGFRARRSRFKSARGHTAAGLV